jgi:tetratricopeptide (TPR) repeat protein
VTHRQIVFISSTITDLEPERMAIDEELTAAEIFEVVRVEKLPAIGQPSHLVCLHEIARADAVVLILDTKYGFVPEKDNPGGLSVTHLEYREAKRLRKPVFAFIRRDSVPEPALGALIQEVENFDEGVLRRTWQFVADLRHEVRRSLLWWLARRARAVASQQEHNRAAAQLLQYPDTSELSVLFLSTESCRSLDEAWQPEFLRQLELSCRRSILPLPKKRADLLPGEPLRSILSLIAETISCEQGIRVSLSIQANQRGLEGDTTLMMVELEPACTSEGGEFMSEAALGLVLFATGDIPGGIRQILSTSHHPHVTDRSREALLRSAAHISAMNKGERSHDVVRQMLGLSTLESATLEAASLCLIAAQLRYEYAHAFRAVDETKKLLFKLLSTALERSEATPEVLYNFGRQVLMHIPEHGVAFYEQVLSLDPSYDERWYFHRDLGLAEYWAGNYEDAARHYDRACHLRDQDSELRRFAGDAYYYVGQWAEALLRYEKALQLEPMEECFLDQKVAFARAKLRRSAGEEKLFTLRQSTGQALATKGVSAANMGAHWIAKPLFKFANFISISNFDANKWLALYANRRGCYDKAISYLKSALTWVPENPSVRLNLVVNLIFRDGGAFGEEARKHARVAIFHGGAETCQRFRVQLTNTPGREILCQEFNIIFGEVVRERDAWVERRRTLLAPEKFGNAVHLEFRT